VTERQEALDAAEAALERLRPFGKRIAGIEVTATADVETEAALRINYLSDGVAWEPSYALRLDSESGALDIERSIILSVDSPARWQGVDVTFSTANPSRQRVPQEVFSRPARIMEEMERLGSQAVSLDSVRSEAAPMPVIVEEAAGFAGMVVEGLAVSYVYGTPVSVGASGEATLPFDALRLDMETEARAAPRFDQTAFLMAMGENDTGEAILPGEALFYRDGALVGESYLDLIPAGAGSFATGLDRPVQRRRGPGTFRQQQYAAARSGLRGGEHRQFRRNRAGDLCRAVFRAGRSGDGCRPEPRTRRDRYRRPARRSGVGGRGRPRRHGTDRDAGRVQLARGADSGLAALGRLAFFRSAI